MPDNVKDKGGRPSVMLDDRQKQLVSYYARNGVPAKYLAELLGIARRTFYNILNRDLEVYALYRRGMLLANVAVSNWLFESCRHIMQKVPLLDENGNQVRDSQTNELKFQEIIQQRGSIEAQKFWLRTRAGWNDRFYKEMMPPMEEDEIDEFEGLSDEDIIAIVEIGRKMEAFTRGEEGN
ncbi:hypothetical protein ES705_15659 [subsurface metagenome]